MSTTRVFGKSEGKDVHEITLQSDLASISILNYGASIRDWRVDGEGKTIPCVLGFAEMDHYLKHGKSHGAICGRVANRIANARFKIRGKEYELVANEGAHQLHGGPKGLNTRVWDMEPDGDTGVQFSYHSPDGEMGYPGSVDFRVVMTLDGSELTMEMHGRPSCETPINLAQHNYYNLNGGGDVLGQVLEIDADMYTPTDAELIPTGSMQPIAGTHMDFRTAVLVGERDRQQRGIDTNLVVRNGRNSEKPVASLWSEDTGLELRIWSDEPGIQVFNAPLMNEAVPGHDGAHYGAFGGLCLEPQKFPDAINKVDWSSTLCTPESPYYQKLVLDIAAMY